MVSFVEYLLHIAVIFAVIKESSAYCYGYCWWTSWYIWFGVVMVFAIGCGALGSYLRRRRLRRLMRNRPATGVVAVVGTDPNAVTSDMPRAYVYHPGQFNSQSGMPPPPPAQMMVPPDYNSVVNDNVDGDKKTAPPSYIEAVGSPQVQQPDQPSPQQEPNPNQQQSSAPYPTQPYPSQPYPTQPYPTQPYPTQPYPTQPYPT